MDQLDLFGAGDCLSNDQLWLLRIVGTNLGRCFEHPDQVPGLRGFGFSPIHLDDAPTWVVEGFICTAEGIRSPSWNHLPVAVSVSYNELAEWIMRLPCDVRSAIADASHTFWDTLYRRNSACGLEGRTLSVEVNAAEARLKTLLEMVCCPSQ